MAQIVIEATLPENVTRAEAQAIADRMLHCLPDGSSFTYGTDARMQRIKRDAKAARTFGALRAALLEAINNGD